jgi:hypothetical protein
MNLNPQHMKTARALAVALIATVSLGACASYKNEFATINSRLDQLDVKVQGAAQSASPPTSPHSRPTSAWTRSKAACSSLKGHLPAASRAGNRSLTV